MEGTMEFKPKDDAPKRGERADIKVPEDNLHPEGEFAKRDRPRVIQGERQSPIKQKDNLRPEGEFTRTPKEEAPKLGERAQVKKPKDNLHMEGKMDAKPRNDYYATKGDRAPVVVHKDHLHMEGEFDETYRSRNDYKVTHFFIKLYFFIIIFYFADCSRGEESNY